MYGGKAFCEHPFALHLQQPEKDMQNVDCAHPWKNFCGRHGYMVYFHESFYSFVRKMFKLKLNVCIDKLHFTLVFSNGCRYSVSYFKLSIICSLVKQGEPVFAEINLENYTLSKNCNVQERVMSNLKYLSDGTRFNIVRVVFCK